MDVCMKQAIVHPYSKIYVATKNRRNQSSRYNLESSHDSCVGCSSVSPTIILSKPHECSSELTLKTVRDWFYNATVKMQREHVLLPSDSVCGGN